MKVTSVYYKPLMIGLPIRGVDPTAVLRKLSRDVLRRMRAQITQTTFSDRAKKALAKALSVEIRPSSLLIKANHPAFQAFLKGRRTRQMTWLKKAKAPIPIVTDSGEVIFRTASARSMAGGGWYHPGSKPQDFISKAKRDARQFIRQQMAKELRREIKAAWVK